MTHDHHPRTTRRQLLIGAAGAALAGAMPSASLAATSTYVGSEGGRVGKALIHPATWADFADSELLAGAHPFWMEAVDEIVASHAAIANRLASTGTQLVYLEDALESAIAEARRAGTWTRWLGRTFPEFADGRDVGAATLLGRGGAGRSNGSMHDLFQLRDFAVMLPNGLVLCAQNGAARRRQADLVRFAMRFAPVLSSYPILFDARDENVRLEGRDLLLLDPHTLLVGIGRRTDPRSVPLLARRTGLDVVAVNLAGRADTFLDAAASQVAPDHVEVKDYVARALTLALERS